VENAISISEKREPKSVEKGDSERDSLGSVDEDEEDVRDVRRVRL
jgi:hypothetical protein